MTEKKEAYRVKRAWVGGPEVGAEIKGPIHAALLPHVERILVGAKPDDSGEKAAKVLEDAKAEAAKILDQARADAEGVLNGAKAEAAKLVEEAKAEADKLLEEATKPKK